MAAPVTKGQELELQIDSLAYGGNGVARLDGFVVFVRRGLPGDTRARARDEGAAPPRRGGRDRGARRPGRSGSTRRARTTPRAAAAASRISPTRRSSRRSTRRSTTRCAGSPASPSRRSSRSSRRAEIFHYRNKMEYSFTPDARTGPTLGLHRAGRWDEVLEIERCWLTTDLGNAIRNTMRDWAREERLEAYDQADAARATSATSSSARARNTGQALVQLVTARARALRPRAADRGADARSRRCGRSTGRSTTRRPR